MPLAVQDQSSRRSPRPTPALCRLGPARDPRAIRRKGSSIDRPMAAQYQSSLPLAHPTPERWSAGSTHDPHAIRRKGGGPDIPLVALQDEERLAPPGVPYPNGVVIGPAHDPRAIGEKAAAQTGARWPRRTKSSSPLAASHTRTVPSADPLTIRAPSDENCSQDPPFMATQDQALLAARGVPYPDGPVLGPARDPRAIRREGGRPDLALMAAQSLQLALRAHGLDQRACRLGDPYAGGRRSRLFRQAREREEHGVPGIPTLQLIVRLLGAVEGIAKLGLERAASAAAACFSARSRALSAAPR